MNIFGIGGTELILIVLIMLVVAGPKRMLQWAYIAGKYLAQLQAVWRELMKGVQKEIDDAGMDLKLPTELPNRQNISRLASQVMQPVQEPVKKAIKEYETEIKGLENSMKVEMPNGTNGRPANLPKPKTPTSPPDTTTGGDARTAKGSFGSWSTPPKEDEQE